MNTPSPLEIIFFAALQKGTPEQRAAYLEEACEGNRDLRERIEKMIVAQSAAGSFLEVPAGDLGQTVDTQPITEKPGSQIGPYKLLEQIGEGGMGVVYMAEQKQPMKRRVALKIIKPGMDTRQVIARFEAERQALAMMDHPNIAKVLDAGQTESGRPYFVMELVNGISVTKYCDQQHLTPKERLQLFVNICQAVQHAHQKGIIHRDLKPSNVLVALYDGKAVPKVIDFGVAKATNQSLTDKTMFTQLGQIVGTLEYMSPEQAQRNQLDVDTRSDIYSLGVILYELLSGETPFDRKQLRSAALEEMLRIIREDEPSKPSTKVSSSESLPSIAANRRIDPQKLGATIRGELDWIVMKALEKDRARRYETASKFAEDVEHYLNDETVQACPPSAAYRFRKLIRRHKGRLAAAGLLCAALLVAVGGIGWAVRDRVAQKQEIARESEERQARTDSQIELVLEEVARLEQEQKWPEALSAAKRAELVLVSSAETTSNLGLRVKQAVAELKLVMALEDARMMMAETSDSGFNYVGGDRAYRQAFAEMGLPIEELAVEQVAERLRNSSAMGPQLAAGLTDWARSRSIVRDNPDEPSVLHFLAVADAIDPDPWRSRLRAMMKRKKGTRGKEFQELASSAPIQQLPPATLVLLANGLLEEVSAEAAVELLRPAQFQHPGDFWLNFRLASSFGKLRPPLLEEQREFYRVALALRPHCSVVRVNLGDALFNQRKPDEAIECFRTAIELDPKFWNAHYNLGVALNDQGKLDEAIESYRTAIEVDPKQPPAYNNLGIALFNQGNLDGAIAEFRTAIELDPKIASAHYNLGIALRQQGKLEEAIDCYRTAIEVDPKFASAHTGLVWLLTTADDPDLRNPSEAVTLARKAIELQPKDANHWCNLGVAEYRAGNWQASVDAFRQADVLIGGRGDRIHRFFLAMAHWQLGNQTRAHEAYEQALDPIKEKMPRLSWAMENWWAMENIDPAREKIRFRDEAEQLMGIAAADVLVIVLASLNRAIEADPENVDLYWARTDALLNQRNWQGVFDDCTTIIKLDPKFWYYERRAWASFRMNDFDGAISDRNEVIRLNPEAWYAYDGRGWAYYYKQQFELALKDANYVLEKRPWDANYLLGHIHLAQGDHEQAINAFQRATGNVSECWSYHRKGWSQLCEGKIDQAAATLDRAVEIAVNKNDRPGVFWSYFSRASLHLEQGNRDQAMADFDEAKKAFDESFALDPALDVGTALTIAITNWHLGNHEQAREHYANAVELIERWPIDRNQYLLRLKDQAKGLLKKSSTAEATSEKDK